MAVGSDPRIGTSLAGYRIEAPLGQGGMGVVYRAHDDALERSVALKLISPGLASDGEFRDRFLVEARLAASLDHPNVIPVYDAGDIDGQLYLAMRHVEGSDLRELLAAEGNLDPERALAICGQVADALDVAHEKGLVHRDVKPSNVLLDERGHAYLADFGLTRRLSDQAPGFDAGLSLGTPAYVAPEQIQSAGGETSDVGPRADQYSLACMLYESLTGQPPYDRASEAATLFAHLDDEPPAYPGLEETFAKALAKNPDERYGTCAEFVQAARDALLGPRRRRLLIAGAAGAVVMIAAAAVAAVLVFTGGDGAKVGDDWTRVPHDEAAFGGSLGTEAMGIAVGESGFVAVGSEGRSPEQSDDLDAAAWTSPDGVVWTKVSDPDLGGPRFQTANSVSAGPTGFVAVGTDFDLEKFQFGTALWHSPDGTSWERVQGSSEVFGGPAGGVMWDVAAAGPGYVVVGWAFDPPAPSAVVWFSSDGLNWSRIPAEPEVFGPRSVPKGLGNLTRMTGVAAAEDGRVAAVGADWVFPPTDEAPPSGPGAAWVSADGILWTRAPHDDAAFGDGTTSLSLDDVVAGGPGFVAVGVEAPGGEAEPFIQETLQDAGPSSLRAVVATTEDGLTWRRVPNEQLPGDGESVALNNIRAGGPGLIAVGYRRDQPGVLDANVDVVVWTSPDGTSWTEAADPDSVFAQPGGQIITSVAQGGPGLVAIGQDGSSKSTRIAIWTSP